MPEPRAACPFLFGVGKVGFNGWSKCKADLDAHLDGVAPWMLHDARRTVATRLGDLGEADEVIGRVLGHAPQGVTRRHYNRAMRLAEQRGALEVWEGELGQIVEGIVTVPRPLHARRWGCFVRGQASGAAKTL